MKPDWKDAPEWAQWLAQDANQVWYWYEAKPIAYDGTEAWATMKRAIRAEVAQRPRENAWRETLEQRPTTGVQNE